MIMRGTARAIMVPTAAPGTTPVPADDLFGNHLSSASRARGSQGTTDSSWIALASTPPGGDPACMPTGRLLSEIDHTYSYFWGATNSDGDLKLSEAVIATSYNHNDADPHAIAAWAGVTLES